MEEDIKALRAIAEKHGGVAGAYALSTANALEAIAEDPNHPDAEQMREIAGRGAAALAKILKPSGWAHPSHQ